MLKEYKTVMYNFSRCDSTRHAKPLLYMVHRTRNQKQLARKWSGKETKFWGDSEKKQRWSWGDVWWRTVPEAASSHRKRTIARVDSRVRRITSFENDDDRRRRRLESATCWISSSSRWFDSALFHFRMNEWNENALRAGLV